MSVKPICFLLFSIQLFAVTTLDSVYYIKNNDINVSTLLTYPTSDAILFKLQKNKYQKSQLL